MQIMKHKNTTT